MRGVHSFGHELRTCSLPGIHVAETEMPAGLVLAGHAHAPGQICFVLEGSYGEEIGGREAVLRPGDVQVHAPGERHANSFRSGDALTLLISVDSDRWIDIDARRLLGSPLLAGIASNVRRELAREEALESLSLVLLSRLETCGREPNWLCEAEREIEEHFDRPISLTTLAAHVGIHRATLAAAFRRFRRTSVGELIRSIRVAHASEALTSTRVPIDEIAQQTGFADQAHLTRVFKRLRGMTPGEFRRYTSKSSK